jgi:hypothetical protein
VSLHSIVVEYGKSHAGSVSAVSKLKDDIKFGFQTKDTAGFGVRLQKDIDYLHAALTVNATSILQGIHMVS